MTLGESEAPPSGGPPRAALDIIARMPNNMEMSINI